MIKLLHHTAISISNLDQSIHFYRDLLGMTLEWRMDHRRSEALEKVVGLKDVDVSYAMLSGWGGRIELFQYHSPQGQPYPAGKPVCDEGITHIGFQVDNIDRICEKLMGHGVRFNSPPQVIRPGVKAAYFYDPDGVALEIIQYLEDDNCGSFVMKALMKIQRGEGHIEFREVEDSKPGADEVLIEVKRACVCDKDIHILHCEFPKTRPPFILGHEFFDVVEVVGKEVREGRAEDRVVSETAAYSCGVCRFCQTGDTQLCLERKVYGHIVEMLL